MKTNPEPPKPAIKVPIIADPATWLTIGVLTEILFVLVVIETDVNVLREGWWEFDESMIVSITECDTLVPSESVTTTVKL